MKGSAQRFAIEFILKFMKERIPVVQRSLGFDYFSVISSDDHLRLRDGKSQYSLFVLFIGISLCQFQARCHAVVPIGQVKRR